ncbi:MAG: chloramphenicol acetyltransferase [Crocinitomicaceae bacterium]|nr:chloramphenicol acetyltransferase [Crocinitomicaceae bacterium]
MKIIDIQNWKRKEHFEFFSKMASPYFGFVAEVDCTKCYENAKEKGQSFYASYFHKSLIAINEIEEFRYRIVGDDVICYDAINAETTIMRGDETFGFARINFSKDFRTFNAELQQEIEAVQNSSGLRLIDGEPKMDVIHFSSIPWNSFTGLLQPSTLDNSVSIPRIVFGKFFIRDNRKIMPVSIEAHHALMDGFHLSKYLAEFQRQLDLD